MPSSCHLTASTNPKVALVTGAAKRIGAEIARALHQQGFNLVIHYHQSVSIAQQLIEELNDARSNSAIGITANLGQIQDIKNLCAKAIEKWQRIDILVNNASSFYSTLIESATEKEWDELMSVNLKAPFFLSTTLADNLKKTRGCIINIADIYADRPLKQHSVYSIAKAGNVMLTKSLAQELAPHVRVNGIAPGAILWPEKNTVESDQEKLTEESKALILSKIPLKEKGTTEDITRTLLFLINDAPYITGQIITVDGGRSVIQ